MKLRQTSLPRDVPTGQPMLNELIYESELLAGGWVVGAILLLSSIMWALILERYWFMLRRVAPLAHNTLATWRRLHSDNAVINKRLRAGLVSGFHQQLCASLGTIQVITAILPLLGLLGTVTGMIKTFEIMTVFGTGNVRGMAGGISQALITTMAGLLTALSGMYFASNLSVRIDTETERLSEKLCLQESQSGTQNSHEVSP